MLLVMIRKIFPLTVLIFFSILLQSELKTALAQDISPKKEVQLPGSKGEPLLIYRFSSPISPGPSWDKLRTPLTSLDEEKRRAYAIRLCSERNLLLALPSAVSDPIQLIKEVKLRYREPELAPPIYLLRSDDCVVSQISNMYAIELWAIADVSRLPKYVEKYEHQQVRVMSFGFDPSICSTVKVNYLKAAKKLIRELRSDQNSYGAVIGYHHYGEKPNTVLQDRIAKVKVLLEKSGLPTTRYIISNEIWHADDSDCVNDPVTKPSIFFITKS